MSPDSARTVSSTGPKAVWERARVDAFKAKLAHDGLTIAQWAAKNSFSHRLAYKILRGHRQALYGTGHDIAVAMGLKDGPVAHRQSIDA